MCFLRRPQKLTKYSLLIWHLLHNVKSTVKISSIFVAFLENMNFKNKIGRLTKTLRVDGFFRLFSLKTRIYSWFFYCYFHWISFDFLQNFSIITFWSILETVLVIIVFYYSDAYYSISLKRNEIWRFLSDSNWRTNFCFDYALLLRNCLLCPKLS